MSKKRKANISEEGNRELSISKAKKISKRKTQLTEKSDLKMSAQTVHTNKCLSKVTAAGINQEYKGNTEREHLALNLDTSSLEDGTKASFQKKDTVFLPPSQGEKLVPVFKKPTKPLSERCDRTFGKTTTVWTEQHVDRNVFDMTEGAVQKTGASEGPHPTPLLETKVEDPKDKAVPCEKPSERLNVQTQDQIGIKRLNNDVLETGLLDSSQGLERESNLQTNISEKKTPEKPNSFFMCTPDNESVNNLEKRQLSLKSFICPFVDQRNFILAQERIIDSSKNIQNEEEHPSRVDMGTEQKVIQAILGADGIKEANCLQNGSRTDVGSVECMAIGSQKQSNFLCTSSVAREGNFNSRETNQFLPYKSEKPEEKNIYKSTEIFEPRNRKHTSMAGEIVIDQHKVQTDSKPVVQSGGDRTAEQNSSCGRETFVGKEHHVGQDISGKDLPNLQSVQNYLEKEIDLYEQNCKQIIATSNQFFPEPAGDIQSESRKKLMKGVSCAEKRWGIKETEMRTTLGKNTIATLDPNIPILPTQQHKENGENLLCSIKQLEFNICDLRPGLEAMSEKKMIKQTLANILMTETKTIRSVSFFTNDSFKDSIVTCEENKNKLKSSLSSEDILPVLVRVSDTTEESKTDSEAQSTLLSSKADSNLSAPSVLDTVAQISTSYTDTLALDLEFLPDSELQGISESNNLECSPHKDKIEQRATGEQSRTKTSHPSIGIIQSNSARDEVICNPSRQEDATDVVCGLIKELSNLNRLIMNVHRDLDSFKRLKLRRNRQPGKLLSHNVNNITNTRCTGGKKRDL
nr:uncharacterized protein C19orf57 homolog [Pogona vitticeps]